MSSNSSYSIATLVYYGDDEFCSSWLCESEIAAWQLVFYKLCCDKYWYKYSFRCNQFGYKIYKKHVKEIVNHLNDFGDWFTHIIKKYNRDEFEIDTHIEWLVKVNNTVITEQKEYNEEKHSEEDQNCKNDTDLDKRE